MSEAGFTEFQNLQNSVPIVQHSEHSLIREILLQTASPCSALLFTRSHVRIPAPNAAGLCKRGTEFEAGTLSSLPVLGNRSRRRYYRGNFSSHLKQDLLDFRIYRILCQASGILRILSFGKFCFRQFPLGQLILSLDLPDCQCLCALSARLTGAREEVKWITSVGLNTSAGAVAKT